MKRLFFIAIGIIAIACLTIVAIGRYRQPWQPMPAAFTIPDAGSDPVTIGTLKPDVFLKAAIAPPAPALASGSWLNSDPVTLEQLRGRVTLIEFWTFGCYNCRNTLPALKQWDATYRERGLTVVGVHTPETDAEHQLDNLKAELAPLGIKYPVVTDNDYHTWDSYHVEAWPTLFVLDKQSRIRWLHVGEGSYDQTESVIKQLLAE